MTKVTIEPIVGRYMHLDIGSRRYRLYWEEAGPRDGGSGIPLSACTQPAQTGGNTVRCSMMPT